MRIGRVDRFCDLCGTTYRAILVKVFEYGTDLDLGTIESDNVRLVKFDNEGFSSLIYHNICPGCYNRIVSFIEEIESSKEKKEVKDGTE